MSSVAKDGCGNLHIVYGSNDSLLYVYSGNGGESFSQPQLVARLDQLLPLLNSIDKDHLVYVWQNNKQVYTAKLRL